MNDNGDNLAQRAFVVFAIVIITLMLIIIYIFKP